MHFNTSSQYSCERKAIGYHTGLKNHLLSNDQVELLSHIVFNGIHIENNGRIVIQNDQSRSLLLDLQFKVRALKSNLKVIISTKYELDYLTEMLKNPARRKVWIDFIFWFINEYEVDGLEFSSLVRGTKEEKENFDFISRELNLEFENFQKQTKREEPYLISLVDRNSNSFMEEASLPPIFFTRSNGTIDGTMAAYVCSDTALRQILFTNPVVGYPEIGHNSSAFIFSYVKYDFSNMRLFNKFV
ncbi:hypothetical protein CRE_12994 [Caenorhabditis remanei]|uniref:GH18 domain-containing protein n=1 Tax=Caenorhabditis remanei TaxID=31234 RepID=E3N157_CAERE|nr:hypothetical protein CRE_12994 [Caenorhabditis remanei]